LADLFLPLFSREGGVVEKYFSPLLEREGLGVSSSLVIDSVSES
jgi:hypothetical protein